VRNGVYAFKPIAPSDGGYFEKNALLDTHYEYRLGRYNGKGRCNQGIWFKEVLA